MTKIIPQRVANSLTNLEALITEVNNKQVTYMGYSNLSAIYNELKIMLNQDANNEPAWKNLLIYTSTYKENDVRYMQLLIQKLYEYAGFYSKILSDNGVQRALSYSKSYSNDGNADSLERGFDSVTPQNSALYNAVESTADELFDKAIGDYASSIDKNKGHSESHNEGESSTEVTGVTWDEQKKNLQMLFYNELCDYLMSIPERIYSYYSIDTIPVPELAKMFSEHIRQVLEMFDTNE